MAPGQTQAVVKVGAEDEDNTSTQKAERRGTQDGRGRSLRLAVWPANALNPPLMKPVITRAALIRNETERSSGLIGADVLCN